MPVGPSAAAPRVCALCGQPADLEVTRFDGVAPDGPPHLACRFCLARPGRAEGLVRRADVVRLRDLLTDRTSTGRATELPALVAALGQQGGYRTITGAIRLSSLPTAPSPLTCAGCGAALTAATGGVVAWIERPDGTRSDPRAYHGHACALDAGRPLRPGAWEDLRHLAALAGAPFDEDALGFLTDLEVAWKALRSG
jgi:hypothetical protein